ncbi:anthranilate synthase component I family protein [Wenzhouxiangella sp. XN24]|uniref:anthranilate synthase component I family protein n=1 Tax=Wenzhouxiangella sp. XN24 TaxID=2713569 RepID=UPI0013ED9336|nr:anthranilate synthase component I family protein [Wenzhouxiangella sp. XN24]NGX17378.1 anthranilate synthase component I family protein [Wenzhouxiangella sp. XN24]
MQAPFDIAADLDTPVSAYMKLAPFRPRFLLESVEGAQRLGRYSFIGFGDALTVRLDREGLHFGGRSVGLDNGLLPALRAALASAPILSPEAGLPFDGGLVGIAGYDIVRHFERVPVGGDGFPEGLWVAPESLLVFDHLTRRAALLHAGDETERVALRREVVQALAGGVPFRRAGRHAPPEASMSEAEFIAAVEKAKGNITAGDVFQLVLSIRFAGFSDLAPFEAYRALRLLNPSPYMYFLELDGLSVAGSSPEALVKLDGRRAALRPIAGTRPRGETHDQDLEREVELLADPKESAEHVMLVDLARNDLGRVAVPGSIQVEPSRAIERYSHVMHIVSGVNGELEADRDAFDLFAATFPAGTLVGAPKVRAMELINHYEPVGRGLYAGTVGYFSKRGGMDQAIAIRTLVFRGDEYSYQAGAGIVADSVPLNEYREVLAKSAILRRALEMAEAGL